MASRTVSQEAYRFGFNGKENDGETGTQDYGFRIYNPALGKFLSVDPLFKDFAWNSPYAFAENDVIRSIDLEGAERYIVIYKYDKDGYLTKINITTSSLNGKLINFQLKGKDGKLLTKQDIYIFKVGADNKLISGGGRDNLTPIEEVIMNPNGKFLFTTLKPTKGTSLVKGPNGETAAKSTGDETNSYYSANINAHTDWMLTDKDMDAKDDPSDGKANFVEQVASVVKKQPDERFVKISNVTEGERKNLTERLINQKVPESSILKGTLDSKIDSRMEKETGRKLTTIFVTPVPKK